MMGLSNKMMGLSSTSETATIEPRQPPIRAASSLTMCRLLTMMPPIAPLLHPANARAVQINDN